MSINIPATALTAFAAVLLAVILFGILAYAECMFARKESFVSGLILPGIFFCMSLVSVVSSLPLHLGHPLGCALLTNDLGRIQNSPCSGQTMQTLVEALT